MLLAVVDCDLDCADGCGDNDGCGSGRGGCRRGCGWGWGWGLLDWCDVCDLLPDRKEQEDRRRRRRRGKDAGEGSAGADGSAVASGTVGPAGGRGAPGAGVLFLVADAVDRVALTGPPSGVAPRSPMRWWSGPRHAGIAAIRLYQRLLSPRLPTRCRYTPTCSAYGLQAVRAYGLVTGSRLALGRIRRCNRHVPRGTSDPLRTVAVRPPSPLAPA